MKLLTKKIETSLPTISAVSDKSLDEIKVMVKFFHPLTNWYWFAFAGQHIQDDFEFYGKVFSPLCPNGEIGYFTLSQLDSISIPFGPITFQVERDKLFEPIPADQLSC